MTSTVREFPRLDAAPLVERIPRPDVARRWAAFVAEQPKARDGIGRMRRVSVTISALAGLAGAPLIGLFALLALAEGGDNAGRIAFGVATMAVMMVLLAVLLVRVAIRVWARRTTRRTHLRLLGFARANGFEYEVGPVGAQRDFPWRRRGALNLNRIIRIPADSTPGAGGSAGERRPRRTDIEIADYEISGNSRNLAAQFGGYCAFRLPTALPHLVLRAQGGRRPGMSSASAPLALQRLSLEGDFDRHFELYCPSGYEADALYLFTPDVMARLIDHVGDLDVEIVDDWIILSTPRDLVTTDPRSWETVAGAVDALDDRVARWAAWRETRPAHDPDDGGLADANAAPRANTTAAKRPVAKAGRRLRMRPSVDNILLTALLALFVIGVVVGLTG